MGVGVEFPHSSTSESKRAAICNLLSIHPQTENIFGIFIFYISEMLSSDKYMAYHRGLQLLAHGPLVGRELLATRLQKRLSI